MLFIVGLVSGPAGTAAMVASEESPRPPCAGASPYPGYANPGASPTIRVWSRRDPSPPWTPPSCTGWTEKGAGVLVALAARFPYSRSSDALLARFGAVSALKGLQYWSVTEGGWRTLITAATALDGPDLGPRPDFTLAEMRSGKDLYFAQADNRAAGDVIYRMRVRELSPTRLVVAIENVSPVRKFMLRLFNPGDLQSLHFLERQGPNVWSYYGLAWAGETGPALLAAPEASYVNRVKAFYRHFVGSS